MACAKVKEDQGATLKGWSRTSDYMVNAVAVRH